MGSDGGGGSRSSGGVFIGGLKPGHRNFLFTYF